MSVGVELTGIGYKIITADLKLIYQATTEIDAQANLEQLDLKRNDKIPTDQQIIT